MESLKIIGFSVLAAISYGILHDQVTAHLCVEYFTIAHPVVFPTTSPFLLAIGWGVIATWWIGLLLGCLLASAARLGPKNKMTFAQLRPSILGLMAISGVAAVMAGIAGFSLYGTGINAWLFYWSDRIPPEKHAAFTAAAWAHFASYTFGCVGGVLLVALISWKRMSNRTI